MCSCFALFLNTYLFVILCLHVRARMYVCMCTRCMQGLMEAKEECRGPWNWSSGWLSHLMSSARAVSALPRWDTSSAWAWLFWALGCCWDSMAGLLILLCLKLPLPYPHTEVPLPYPHTEVPLPYSHTEEPRPYPHTEVPRHTEYGVWAHSRFECRGCFQYTQSQKTIGWFQKAGQEKTHECFTNFGQEQVSSTVPEPLQVTTQAAGKTDLHTEAPAQSPTWAGFFRDAMIQLCGGKCITGLTEICKHRIPLDLSGQGNFPVFPAAQGPNDGNQPPKASGILPLLRCLDGGRR